VPTPGPSGSDSGSGAFEEYAAEGQDLWKVLDNDVQNSGFTRRLPIDDDDLLLFFQKQNLKML
jgi:hypothetical protein